MICCDLLAPVRKIKGLICSDLLRFAWFYGGFKGGKGGMGVGLREAGKGDFGEVSGEKEQGEKGKEGKESKGKIEEEEKGREGKGEEGKAC